MIKSCDLSKYISQNLLYNFEDALNIFIYLFIYLFIHLFIYLFIYLFMYLFIYLSF